MNNQQRAALMSQRVDYLASPELAGRATGTEGGLVARQYVATAFADLGLEPAGDNGTYAHAIASIGSANLLGAIPGHGKQAQQYLMLAAHYDHLGEQFGEIYPGADDNASGVAILLDVAARLTERDDLGRSVLICSFDAEEPPHFYSETMGSVHWVERPTIDLHRLDVMICLDIVGHALGPSSMPDEVRNSMFVAGAERAGIGSLIDDLGDHNGRLIPRRLSADIVPPLSDHAAFQEIGIPNLFYTNGRDRNYHSPQDTPEHLDYAKMVGLADHLTNVVCSLAEGPAPLYDPEGIDDAATLRTLVEVGRHAGSLHAEADRLMALIDRLEQKLEDGTELSGPERGGLQSSLLALEEALS